MLLDFVGGAEYFLCCQLALYEIGLRKMFGSACEVRTSTSSCFEKSSGGFDV